MTTLAGGPLEGPDVDYDIANTLSQTIVQHNGKCLLSALFCEEMAGVLSDEMWIGIVIPWDSLVHCWKIGNGRYDGGDKGCDKGGDGGSG